MPNHVANMIEFYGDQKNINKVFELIKGEDSCIDFNKIIPMPKSLQISSSSDNDIAIVCYLSNRMTVPFEEISEMCSKYITNMFDQNWAATLYHERLPNRTEDFDELYELGKVCYENIINHGHKDWYGWCIENWGTKWDAYDTYLDEKANVMTFNTAWSCPLPIFDKLAEICYEYRVSFSGKWADEDRGSNEAYDIYVELQGETECMGKDEYGNWISYDCDTCPNKCY